eukprot:7385549-Prymnesium_polylepis.3
MFVGANIVKKNRPKGMKSVARNEGKGGPASTAKQATIKTHRISYQASTRIMGMEVEFDGGDLVRQPSLDELRALRAAIFAQRGGDDDDVLYLVGS